MEFIGIGDIHADKLDALIENVNGKIEKALRRVLRYALENGVRVVIFYGDVCDKPIMSYDGHMMLMRVLMDPKYADLDFHMILGNHDFAENGHHSMLLIEMFSKFAGRNLTVYTQPELVKLEKRLFWMMPYPCVETKREALNIGHFEVNGSYRDNGRKVDHGIQTKHAGCFGHLHTCHKVKRIRYSGTLYQTNFGEALPKSFHHVRYDDKDPYNIEVTDVPFDPPWKLLNLEIATEADLKKIESDPDVLYKLFIQEGLEIDLGDVLAQHPNVVRHNKFKSKAELQELIENEWDFQDQAFVNNNIDTAEVVEEFLAKKFKLSKPEIARAFSILDRVRGNTTKES